MILYRLRHLCQSPYLAPRLKLALFGFVFLFVVSSAWCVVRCFNRTYVHFVVFEIGFVLHKKGSICRGFSTIVEKARFSMLDTGCLMLDTGYWMLDAGYLILVDSTVIGYWLMVSGY